MEFEIAEQDAQTVVTIAGEVDISNVESLDRAVWAVLERAPRRLIVDVGELRFADSTALAIWVRWSKAVDVFLLRGAQPLLIRVIETMGLTTTLPIEG